MTFRTPDNVRRQIEGANEEVLFNLAFAETQRILKENQIQIEDFHGIFDAKKIAADSAFVEAKKKVFEEGNDTERKESKKLSLIFEAVFQEGARYGWLGEGATVTKASELDDWKHGIDSIVEFEQQDKGKEHLAVGVDVTYSGQLKSKFQDIKNGIQIGALAPVEYFRSGNFVGRLENVPRVIVGVERGNLIKLCRDMFAKPDEKLLKKHPLQVLQLKQMRLQLDAFAAYAESLGKKEVAALYRRDGEIIRKILQKKRVTEGIRMGEWENDRVFFAIQKELEHLK